MFTSVIFTESKLRQDGSITSKMDSAAESLLSLLRKCAWAPSKDDEADANYTEAVKLLQASEVWRQQAILASFYLAEYIRGITCIHVHAYYSSHHGNHGRGEEYLYDHVHVHNYTCTCTCRVLLSDKSYQQATKN